LAKVNPTAAARATQTLTNGTKGGYLIVPKVADNWINTCRARCGASSSGNYEMRYELADLTV